MTKDTARDDAAAKRYVFLCPSCIELHRFPAHDLFSLPHEGWETCEWCCSRARFLVDVQGVRRD